MTTENHLDSANKEDPQDKIYADIIAKTLEHSFVHTKGTTLTDIGIVAAKPFKSDTQNTAAESTVQDDNQLFNLETELSRKRHEAEVERKKTGKHIRLREG